ncbi:conserved hypothetical protein (plasmid) [Burkholderia vietnamiensis G4]|uniref:Lipoprotein n=1 Tax=Burkholderia vietnamiensis (strain G4 / LMG 22486) TaxID=269482 RepID=A4JTZ2_BURVG|nr:conserved hypothetical protein [Burkholderia vietnamiensis G4]
MERKPLKFLRKQLSLAVSLGLLAVCTSASAQPRSVDARQLDVAGVKTGMDYNEALTAASNYLHVPKSQFKPDQYPGVNQVTGKRDPAWFTYDNNGAKLTVYFEGRVPVDKARPLVVWLVRYEVPWSQDNAAAMVNSASQKYGVASNAPNTLPMQWCDNPNPNTGLGCPKNMSDAWVELTQTAIALTDTSWQQARFKFVDAKKKVAPAF